MNLTYTTLTISLLVTASSFHRPVCRSHAERRFSMFRFKRYDETLLAETLARFGREKLAALPLGESDRAPVAMLLAKRK